MDYNITYQIWPHNFQEENKQARGMRLHQISKETYLRYYISLIKWQKSLPYSLKRNGKMSCNINKQMI